MKYLLSAGLIITALPLQAAIPVNQAIEVCRAEQNALRRLTCYDAIPTINNETQAVVSSSTAQASSGSDKDFGIEHKKTVEDAKEILYLTVKEVRYSPHQDLIIEFENGQVWRQNDTGYYKIAAGETHYIKRGALDSFLLGNDQNNRLIRVRRVQ